MKTFVNALVCVFAFLATGWLTLIVIGFTDSGANAVEAGICIIAGLLGVVIALCVRIYQKLNEINRK